MDNIRKIATENQERAWQIIEQSGVIDIWQSIGAKPNLVGSLRMGLLVKNRDIDFHIYSADLELGSSFAAMALFMKNPSVKKMMCINLIDTEEACIEWHAWYEDQNGDQWTIDMIHIRSGSKYDGFMESVADRIVAIMTQEMKETILRLKYETPGEEEIKGIEYYQAVIRDGVRTYPEFLQWRTENAPLGVVDWTP